MRTRGMRGEAGPGQAGARLESSSSESATDQERSSLIEPETADSLSANSGMLDLEEPVLSIGDKRIRSLMAQSTTEKMLLEGLDRGTERFKTKGKIRSF